LSTESPQRDFEGLSFFTQGVSKPSKGTTIKSVCSGEFPRIGRRSSLSDASVADIFGYISNTLSTDCIPNQYWESTGFEPFSAEDCASPEREDRNSHSKIFPQVRIAHVRITEIPAFGFPYPERILNSPARTCRCANAVGRYQSLHILVGRFSNLPCRISTSLPAIASDRDRASVSSRSVPLVRRLEPDRFEERPSPQGIRASSAVRVDRNFNVWPANIVHVKYLVCAAPEPSRL
jgi:hypothetical protein